MALTVSLLLKTHSVNNNVLQCLYLDDGRAGMRDLPEMAIKKNQSPETYKVCTVENLLKFFFAFLVF